jgi:hypothetical protein
MGRGKRGVGKRCPKCGYFNIHEWTTQCFNCGYSFVGKRRVLGGRVVNYGTHSKAFKVLKIFIVVVLLIATIILTVNHWSVLSSYGARIGSNIKTEINQVQPTINKTWVDQFISIVNSYRSKNDEEPLIYSVTLSNFSAIRFSTMSQGKDFEISHYGFDQNFNSFFGGQNIEVGEEVFYPLGATPEEYVNMLIHGAPNHWSLLMDASMRYYGFYIGYAPSVATQGSCAIQEISQANINVSQYFIENGCTPIVINTVWLVIDLASTNPNTEINSP